ncbi:MAG: NADPH:quinone oxidoreductase family protein [Roseinatronobacter sp.]
MRALLLDTLGKPPRVTTCAPPSAPKPGEVLIDCAACGLNFADLLMIEGRYQEKPELPFAPGLEVSGTVRALGAGVTGLRPGQRVAAFLGHGGLAEQVLCPAAHCLPLPDTLSDIDAAGFLIAYATSHLALLHRAGLRAHETLLVLGAAGGVGLTAVEIGAALGARVIAVARGADKLAIARDKGAEVCLDSTDLDLRAQMRALGGCNVVYDTIGEPLATPALRSLRPEGRFLTIGFAGGVIPQFPANILLVKNLTVIGFALGGTRNFAPERITQSLSELIAWHSAGRITPHVSHVLPLDAALDGLDLLRTRKSTGKIVIRLHG